MSYDYSGDRRLGGAFSDAEKQYLLLCCRDSDANLGTLGSGGRGWTFAELACMMSRFFYPEATRACQYNPRHIYDEIVANPEYYERTRLQHTFSNDTELNR
jgi:hypothetical protein